MVPVFYTQLDALPQTSSGKVDRKALSQMEIRMEKVHYIHPKTKLEKQMSQLWKEVLRIEKVGLRDDFFQIGGDSLSVIMLHQRVKQEIEAEVSIANLYRYRTIEAFLGYLNQRQRLLSSLLQAWQDEKNCCNKAMKKKEEHNDYQKEKG